MLNRGSKSMKKCQRLNIRVMSMCLQESVWGDCKTSSLLDIKTLPDLNRHIDEYLYINSYQIL